MKIPIVIDKFMATRIDEDKAPASGAAGTASKPSACRADPEVHAGAMRV
jgi:hypothetical protein